jgi:hypothetical protein
MQPFYRFAGTGGNSTKLLPNGVAAAPQFPITRPVTIVNYAARFAQILPCGRSIGPIRSYDLPLEPPRRKLTLMTVSLATACFALLAAVLHFLSYKLKKTAERKTFHANDAT